MNSSLQHSEQQLKKGAELRRGKRPASQAAMEMGDSFEYYWETQQYLESEELRYAPPRRPSSAIAIGIWIWQQQQQGV